MIIFKYMSQYKLKF